MKWIDYHWRAFFCGLWGVKECLHLSLLLLNTLLPFFVAIFALRPCLRSLLPLVRWYFLTLLNLLAMIHERWYKKDIISKQLRDYFVYGNRPISLALIIAFLIFFCTLTEWLLYFLGLMSSNLVVYILNSGRAFQLINDANLSWLRRLFFFFSMSKKQKLKYYFFFSGVAKSASSFFCTSAKVINVSFAPIA